MGLTSPVRCGGRGQPGAREPPVGDGGCYREFAVNRHDMEAWGYIGGRHTAGHEITRDIWILSVHHRRITGAPVPAQRARFYMIEHDNTMRQGIYLMLCIRSPGIPTRSGSGATEQAPGILFADIYAEGVPGTGAAVTGEHRSGPDKNPIFRRAIRKKFGIYQDFYSPSPNGY